MKDFDCTALEKGSKRHGLGNVVDDIELAAFVHVIGVDG